MERYLMQKFWDHFWDETNVIETIQKSIEMIYLWWAFKMPFYHYDQI